MPYSDPFQALAYGPVVGEYGQSQMIGAYDNPLGQYDVALSPDKLKKYPLGSFVTAHDKAGNVLGNYRVADASYQGGGKAGGPGPVRPTKGVVEFRDADRSGQQVFLSPSATPPPGTGPYQYQAPPQAQGGSPGIAQQVLDNYGVGGPTGSPSGYTPGMEQPQSNQVADFLNSFYNLQSQFVPQRRKYNPYLSG